MITEDYVSFEVAKLLKDKGFDEKCSRWYVANEPQEGIVEKGFGENQFYINAPTHQMAMKWLREIHKVLIVIDAYHADHWEGYIDTFEISIYSHASTIIVPYEIAHHTDYEKAVEVALKYALENLI